MKATQEQMDFIIRMLKDEGIYVEEGFSAANDDYIRDSIVVDGIITFDTMKKIVDTLADNKSHITDTDVREIARMQEKYDVLEDAVWRLFMSTKGEDNCLSLRLPNQELSSLAIRGIYEFIKSNDNNPNLVWRRMPASGIAYTQDNIGIHRIATHTIVEGASSEEDVLRIGNYYIPISQLKKLPKEQ